MTQEILDSIKSLQALEDVYSQETDRLIEEKKQLKIKREKIRKEILDLCDCKFPDGASTWNSGYLISSCSLCNRDDY